MCTFCILAVEGKQSFHEFHCKNTGISSASSYACPWKAAFRLEVKNNPASFSGHCKQWRSLATILSPYLYLIMVINIIVIPYLTLNLALKHFLYTYIVALYCNSQGLRIQQLTNIFLFLLNFIATISRWKKLYLAIFNLFHIGRGSCRIWWPLNRPNERRFLLRYSY